jgi:hypothetical protein
MTKDSNIETFFKWGVRAVAASFVIASLAVFWYITRGSSDIDFRKGRCYMAGYKDNPFLREEVTDIVCVSDRKGSFWGLRAADHTYVKYTYYKYFWDKKFGEDREKSGSSKVNELREEGFNAEHICDRPVFGDRYETRKELKEREIDN